MTKPKPATGGNEPAKPKYGGDTAVELEQRANRMMRDAATLQTEALILLTRAALLRREAI